MTREARLSSGTVNGRRKGPTPPGPWLKSDHFVWGLGAPTGIEVVAPQPTVGTLEQAIDLVGCPLACGVAGAANPGLVSAPDRTADGLIDVDATRQLAYPDLLPECSRRISAAELLYVQHTTLSS